MSAEITKLKPEPAAAVGEMPAFKFTVARNFGEGAQVFIEVPMTGGATTEDSRRIMDAASDLVFRQEARFEITLLDAALTDKRAALALQHTRKGEAEQVFQAKGKQFEQAIERLQGEHDRKLDDARAAWHESGRKGEFKAEGALATELREIRKKIKDTAGAEAVHLGEHDQLVGKPNGDIIEKLTNEIAAIERQLAGCRRRVGE